MKKIILALSLVPSLLWSTPTKELKIGLSQEFDTLHQAVSGMLASHYIYYSVGRALVILDSKGQWQPEMAVRIPSFEKGDARIEKSNGVSKIIADWEIRKNAKWSDGTPVTCADFQFALDVANAPTVTIANKDNYAIVEKIEWQDSTPQKCRFHYVPNRWDYAQIGRFTPFPAHLEKPIFEKHKLEKEGYEKNSLYQKEPTRAGLYNGPYKVVDYKPAAHVVVTPNEHFYGEKPYFEKVIFRIVPNTGTLEANMQSGEIDMITQFGYSIEQALDFEKRSSSKGNFTFHYESSLAIEHIDFDLTHPALKEKKVRQALAYGLNRQEMIDALFEGKQKRADQFFHPTDPWAASEKQIKVYKYDTKKAAQLLDEAGWKLNSSDNFRYKDGQKLSFRLMTTAGNKSREVVQTFIQNEWRKLGAEVTIKNEPARVFFGETLRKKQFGGAALFAWTLLPEKSPRSFVHSDSIPSEKNNWSGRNHNSWNSKKVDQFVEKMEFSFDDKQRKKAALEFSKLYTEELPAIPLFYRTETVITPKNMKGLKVTGHLFSETNSIEDWRLE